MFECVNDCVGGWVGGLISLTCGEGLLGPLGGGDVEEADEDEALAFGGVQRQAVSVVQGSVGFEHGA